MISFYPGPSRLDPHMPEYMAEACVSGILSENHRSEAFVNLSKKCIELLKEKLNIPHEYSIFFTSSATECWHILSVSFKDPSFHIFNGAFGEKWYEATRALKSETKALRFDQEEEINIKSIPEGSKIICHTHNETSNGTALSASIIASIRKEFSQALIFSDVTSSIGGTVIDFSHGDIWFASVQKCFGLPAGLGLMICSPKAIDRALTNRYTEYFNSICNLYEKMKLWQTPFTPNVLGIYLLMKKAMEMENIKLINKKLSERATVYNEFFLNRKKINLLISSSNVRSETVVAIRSDEATIKEIKSVARKAGLLLGNGYGGLAVNTFRVANFPSIQNDEIQTLLEFLEPY